MEVKLKLEYYRLRIALWFFGSLAKAAYFIGRATNPFLDEWLAPIWLRLSFRAMSFGIRLVTHAAEGAAKAMSDFGYALSQMKEIGGES